MGYFRVVPKKEKKKKFPHIEKFEKEKIKGVFEGFNYERDFAFFCWETNEFYENVNYLGIKIPIGKKEHLQKFKNFIIKNAV